MLRAYALYLDAVEQEQLRVVAPMDDLDDIPEFLIIVLHPRTSTVYCSPPRICAPASA